MFASFLMRYSTSERSIAPLPFACGTSVISTLHDCFSVARERLGRSRSESWSPAIGEPE